MNWVVACEGGGIYEFVGAGAGVGVGVGSTRGLEREGHLLKHSDVVPETS